MPVQNHHKTFLEDQREFFDALITEDWETYSSASWDESRRYEIACLFKKVQPSRFWISAAAADSTTRRWRATRLSARSTRSTTQVRALRRQTRAYPHPKVSRFVDDLAKDTPRQRYDLVVSFQVFEHLSSPKTYFSYCRDACAPGGSIAIFTPNRIRLSNRLRARRGLAPELLDPQHFKEYTAAEIVELGRHAGFGAASYFGYGAFGATLVDKLPNRWRLRFGRAFPAIASGLCVILKAKAGS